MFTSSDLAASASRLKREQAATAAKDAERAARRAAEAGRAAAAREAVEEAKRVARLAQLQAEEEALLRSEAALEANAGVSWSETLAALPADEAAPAARGIRRAADKLTLPASARRALDAQGATFWAGAPPLFVVEALAADGVTSLALTHAGVLEYEAPAGAARLPSAVVRSLWGGGKAAAAAAGAAPPLGARVRITYVRLPPGEYARLQPVQAGLASEGGEEGEEGGGGGERLRAALEAAVKGRCALTVGDVLTIPAPAAPPGAPPRPPYTVLVRELRPVGATGGASVVEVDLAVDLDPSIEGEAAAAGGAAAAEGARARAAAAAAVAAERLAAALKGEAGGGAAAAPPPPGEARLPPPLPPPPLPPEPGAASPLALSIRCRLPSGGSATRRWGVADPASAVVAWAAHAAGRGARQTRLVAPPLPGGGGGGGGRVVLPADATPLGEVPGFGAGVAVVLVVEAVE